MATNQSFIGDKTSAQEYIDSHGLQKPIEDVINACVKDRAEEPMSFMAELMGRLSPSKIKQVQARMIYDSRGNPTVECDVTTNKGTFRAAVPSGASTGEYEAVELRDKGERHMGKGVDKAVSSINETIGPKLIGHDPSDQASIDNAMREMDGTDNKAKLGANAILAVSMSVCNAGAHELGLKLHEHIGKLGGNSNFVMPVPAFNVINGGSHAGNALAFQEFMVLPVGASNIKHALQMASETYHHLKNVIKSKYGLDATNVGDEGGFAPGISSNKEALQLLVDAIDKAGYSGKLKIAIDVAASEFYLPSEGKYDLGFKSDGNDESLKMTGDQLADMYEEYCKEFPIVSIEDPFDQDDFESTKKLTERSVCQVVGDDLLVTNPTRVKTAINQGACNALLLKVNQIGSVTEAIEAVKMAKEAGWGVMASHRSGETEDHFLADLAVGLSTGQIKSGATCRSERLAKYNQLMRIENGLSSNALYAGDSMRHIPLRQT